MFSRRRVTLSRIRMSSLKIDVSQRELARAFQTLPVAQPMRVHNEASVRPRIRTRCDRNVVHPEVARARLATTQPLGPHGRIFGAVPVGKEQTEDDARQWCCCCCCCARVLRPATCAPSVLGASGFWCSCWQATPSPRSAFACCGVLGCAARDDARSVLLQAGSACFPCSCLRR